MLKNLVIVWEMAKALNLQIKDSEYNFKLQVFTSGWPKVVNVFFNNLGFDNVGSIGCQRGGILTQNRSYSLVVTQ
jgi:hypothetical protein